MDILIVDDGSPDGTGDIVKELQKEFPGRLHLKERAGKLGLGTAYIAGFKWALGNDYRYICEMDADFSHDPDDLIRLCEACVNGADMSVGSRYVKGGSVKDWTLERKVLSYCASLYVRSILMIGVRDTTAGFVCYTRNVLATLDLDAVRSIGYAFQVEMKYRVKKHGFKIEEVPITFKDRVKGNSKMSMNIFKEAMWGVLKMRGIRV
jgi:dolichol-phosphate mannosyltransferase